MEALFGEGSELAPIKTLMGGQFAAKEFVTILGPNLRPIEKVRVLGPLREYTQVEISRTDGYTLGLDPPVRDSGDLKDAAPATLVGPKGALSLRNGCIIARRHAHMSTSDAEAFGVADGREIGVMLSGGRGGLMENVLIRVSPSFTLEMHIDTDEANAFGVIGGCCGTVVY
jgi:putative phosphotransacetylase